METFKQSLEGYKTYLVAGATVLYCILGLTLHFMTVPMAFAFIGTAGSIAALRSGVGKAQVILEVILEMLKLIGQSTPTTTTVVTPVTEKPVTVTTVVDPTPVVPTIPVAPVVPEVPTPTVEPVATELTPAQ
jgi:hypothetical protein